MFTEMCVPQTLDRNKSLIMYLRVSLWSAKSERIIRGHLSIGINRYPPWTNGLFFHSLGR